MLDPLSKPRLPLRDIEEILMTRSLSATSYKRIRNAWFGWLAATGQPRKPISLSPMEESTLDFIDYQLSDEEKTSCLAWATENEQHLLVFADEIVHAGYRITFTHDDKNDCIVVTIIGRSKTNVNYNRAMTTRHADIGRALLMAVYKQVEVFDGNSWGASDIESTFG